MISLIAYRKVIDAVTTHYLKLPEAPQGQQAGQEIATLPDGRTVVALADGATLPQNQPSEIAASIEVLPSPLPADLAEQIKSSSPQVQLSYARTEAMIRSRYSASDEAKFARIGVGVALGMYQFGPGEKDELLAFGGYVEECRAWGRAERAKIGL